MCTRSHRAKWLIDRVLSPAHQLFLEANSHVQGVEDSYMGYPQANLSSIIIGATNSFFVHAYQMSEMFGVDAFAKEEVERHADIIVEILFAKFERDHSHED